MPYKTCITTNAKSFSNGYGQKYSKFAKTTRNAHRVAWENQFGEIPKGLVVMHSCDNRLCVNLDHLSLGTQSENIQQAYDRGRMVNNSCDNHGMAKLTPGIVGSIIHLAKSGIKQYEIAKMYNVNQSTVSRLKNKRRWSNGPI